MSEEDRKLQKHLVDEMMKVSKTNPDVMFYMEALMKKYEELEQKVEQLEKENIRQKEVIENLTTMTVCGDKKQIKNTAQYKLEQLENIRKEAIEECKSVIGNPEHAIVSKNELMKIMLNILNKGDNK